MGDPQPAEPEVPGGSARRAGLRAASMASVLALVNASLWFAIADGDELSLPATLLAVAQLVFALLGVALGPRASSREQGGRGVVLWSALVAAAAPVVWHLLGFATLSSNLPNMPLSGGP